MSVPSTAQDFNIYQALWSIINDVCAPIPPPGIPAKACFLMEMPGFSVNPDAFDPAKFDPATQVSPDYAAASLSDRVPALAQYFYDTGSHISFYWKQFMETYAIKETDNENAALKQQYDEAITMLYGSPQGYVKQQKTDLYKNLNLLRLKWQVAAEVIVNFKTQCQTGKDKANWPENFEKGVPPYLQIEQAAYLEYNNLNLQVEKYEATIFQYPSGNLAKLMLEQASVMQQYQMVDVGNSGATFYKVTYEPSDWWKWFRPDATEDGYTWTHVTVDQTSLYQSSHQTYSQVCAEGKASYGGLFYSGSASGGLSKQTGNTPLTEKESNLVISFNLHKVAIKRPWLEEILLQYPTLGINGLNVGAWSSGKLDPKTNVGSFPLLPTAFVVAKDVKIRAASFSPAASTAFETCSTHPSVKVGIGPFTASGNYSKSHVSQDSSSSYDAESKTLTIHGAQIIGWVCVANPLFPRFEPLSRCNL